MIEHFEVGAAYTAAEIAESLGGDEVPVFPLVDGRPVALRLRPDLHPAAPDLVHVDDTPLAAHALQTMVTDREPVPVFLRDQRRRLFTYLGVFRGVAFDRDPERLREEGERVGRRLLGLLELERL